MHYLVGLLAIPLVMLCGRRWMTTQARLLALATITVLAVYGATVASAFATSAFYSYQADRYDKDQDGVISLAEQSPAQSEAMERSINDSGRSLTVFFAVPWALASTAVAFGALAVIRVMSRKRATCL
jgi:hypothetical protein